MPNIIGSYLLCISLSLFICEMLKTIVYKEYKTEPKIIPDNYIALYAIIDSDFTLIFILNLIYNGLPMT